MDQIWARDVVLTQLKRRAAAGEPPVGLLELQQLAGLGPGDLTVTLGVLAEEGKVREHSGGATAVFDMMPEGEAPAAAAQEEATAAAAAAEPDIPSPWPTPGEAARTVRADGEPRELVLTNHVVQAIDSETLGAMVLAGVIEAGEAGAEFRLVVRA